MYGKMIILTITNLVICIIETSRGFSECSYAKILIGVRPAGADANIQVILSQ